MSNISVRIDSDLKTAMDKFSYLNWSEIIRQAIRKQIEQESEKNLAKALLLNEQVRVDAPEGYDSTEVITKFRKQRRWAMNRLVIDASVIVKWYINEDLSANAILIRDAYINGKIEIISPNLLYYEVINALKYSNLLEQKKIEKAGWSLENYGIIQYPLIGEYRTITINIGVNHQISIYDASYIGLAIFQNTKFITADKKLKKKLPTKENNRIIDLIDVHGEIFN
jgi:predicted nucleic acid-binding protein/Arc/MetJ-type ribon-helix-helix transcriptional regulator